MIDLIRNDAWLVGMALRLPIAAVLANTIWVVPVTAQRTSSSGVRQSTAQQSHPDTIVVTGERVQGYAVPETNAATKITADILEVPVSVQAIGRELIDDLSAVRTAEIVQYTSGVFQGSQTQADGDNLIIRGFQAAGFLRDGYPYRNASIRDAANLERLEVLKGPASVLYGRLEPGGTVNYVTKRPLDSPFAAMSARVDQFGLVRVTGDVSVTNAPNTMGLRLNAAIENGGTFRDYTFSDRVFVSAASAVRLASRTTLDLDVEYLYDSRTPDRAGIPIVGGRPAPVPVDRVISEPDDFRTVRQVSTGYRVQHDFSDTLSLRQILRYNRLDGATRRTQPRTASLSPNTVTLVYPNGDIDRSVRIDDTGYDEIVAQLEVIGTFDTGVGINHSVLAGIERDASDAGVREARSRTNLPSNRINIFDPVYGRLEATGLTPSEDSRASVRSWSAYAQDLVRLGSRLVVLLGARYDAADTATGDRLDGTTSAAETRAVSPRAGIVYRPTENSSLYVSYARSFVPEIGQDFAGEPFDPTRGRQIEFGAKARLLGGRITTSAAAFRIRKTNVAVDDPENPGFDIQVGAVESKGFEVDTAATLADGLNLVANLSYARVRVVEDTRPLLLGTRPNNVPAWGGGAFVSYEARRGTLRGLGGGLGIVHVGHRDSSNSGRDNFTVDGYERIDLNLWFERGGWRGAVKLENLLDTRYVDSTSNGGVRFGAPRNVALTISRVF